MSDILDRLEQRIEDLVEGSLKRLVGYKISVETLSSQMAHAMLDSVRHGDDGRRYAPDQYALSFHPLDADRLLDIADEIQEQLAEGLLEAARGSKFHLLHEPQITFAADPTLNQGQIRVIAWHSSNPLEYTQAMPREPKTQPGTLPKGAFLIVEGDQHFPLDRPVVNIGRRLDNQLILDDPHVSRTHAQLRAREGRFVLFDLGSTAGTSVNDLSVKQQVLRAGDVIKIASISLIYGEDPGEIPDQTPPYAPPFPPRPSGDQRTHTIPKDLTDPA